MDEDLVQGPWTEDLKNTVPFSFYYKGYKCKINRNMFLSYCGYVTLPPTHPYYRKDYSELEGEICVHGDLTFGEDGTFGFDCNHVLMGDLSPVDESMRMKHPEMKVFERAGLSHQYHYWTFEEVKKETKSMANQFIKLHPTPFCKGCERPSSICSGCKE